MEKIVNNVLGELTYKYSWIREDKLSLWGQCYDLRISASDPDKDGISEEQCLTFQEIWLKLGLIIEENESQLERFLASTADENQDNIDVRSILTPRTFLIQQNGDWGVLFDSLFEIEHGVALFSINNNINVGIQDEFL